MPPSSIIKECSEFLESSNGRPIFRMLPTAGEGFRKIKIRKKTRHNKEFERYFDMAFREQYKDLRLRSMIAQTKPLTSVSSGMEEFYIFPPNGFQVMFNKQVESYVEYIDSLQDVIASSNNAEELLRSLFRYTYTNGDIGDAIAHGSDILIYDIPYYYAVRKSLFPDYSSFITY